MARKAAAGSARRWYSGPGAESGRRAAKSKPATVRVLSLRVNHFPIPKRGSDLPASEEHLGSGRGCHARNTACGTSAFAWSDGTATHDVCDGSLTNAVATARNHDRRSRTDGRGRWAVAIVIAHGQLLEGQDPEREAYCLRPTLETPERWNWTRTAIKSRPSWVDSSQGPGSAGATVPTGVGAMR